MKKKLGIIVFTALTWLWVLIAAAFALDNVSNDIYFNAGGAILYLILAGMCEWVKYKITNSQD